ncbi:MAG: T9SS type A sorting domain-containing protein [Bacteroidota bacterium]
MRVFLCYIVIFLSLELRGQANFVLNPSFEDTLNCPDGIGQINKCLFWNSPSNNTPDYYNSCYVYSPPWFSNAGVPYNFVGYQNAKSGNAYAGIAQFNQFTNLDYIQGFLTNTLIAGREYYAEFYVSFADSQNIAIDRIGLGFSSSLYYENTIGKINIVPIVENDFGNIIYDSLGWTKISGYFTATGNENYVIIGLFRDTSEFTWDTTRYNPMGGYGSYYYIDDVYVGDPPDTNIYEVSVFPNPNNGNFTLNYNLDEDTDGIFYLYDAIGRKVYMKKLNQNNGSFPVEVILSSGVYIWEVRGNKRIKTGKMVVSNN